VVLAFHKNNGAKSLEAILAQNLGISLEAKCALRRLLQHHAILYAWFAGDTGLPNIGPAKTPDP
jgi:hypothetical protein